jgi:large subunit ribosomal protein L25
VLKEAQRHPVRGETVHVDLLRVRLDQAIHALVPLELTGVDDAPGVKEGGVLEQITRELNAEALPNDIPESIVHDVGEMQIGETILLSAIAAPQGLTLLDEIEETVVATLSPPKLQAEVAEEIEAETELVGEGEEGEEPAEAEEAPSEDSSDEE